MSKLIFFFSVLLETRLEKIAKLSLVGKYFNLFDNNITVCFNFSLCVLIVITRKVYFNGFLFI